MSEDPQDKAKKNKTAENPPRILQESSKNPSRIPQESQWGEKRILRWKENPPDGILVERRVAEHSDLKPASREATRRRIHPRPSRPSHPSHPRRRRRRWRRWRLDLPVT